MTELSIQLYPIKFFKHLNRLIRLTTGPSGGQVVSVLAFYSDDPSMNPADTVFSVKFLFEKNKNKQKEAGVGPF